MTVIQAIVKKNKIDRLIAGVYKFRLLFSISLLLPNLGHAKSYVPSLQQEGEDRKTEFIIPGLEKKSNFKDDLNHLGREAEVMKMKKNNETNFLLLGFLLVPIMLNMF
ncbi:hypothetical protein ACJX0J_012521, partial [Zea mays]